MGNVYIFLNHIGIKLNHFLKQATGEILNKLIINQKLHCNNFCLLPFSNMIFSLRKLTKLTSSQ